ncbi:glycine-rich protein [Aurantibacillus circumpalustris]|uniref:glycine-rich protein n=1 Tax=Aurantibacillus circumpalustris TaxID=3036359 RepID=UPI00295B3EA0|nr:glycine-rich protein [Aurantibacillus circumpalustris]
MKRKIYKLLSSVKQGLLVLALTVFSGTAYSQTTYTFSYTGSVQTIGLPAGNYSIECWGADGGSATNGTNLILGGKGGYSRGVYVNPSTTTFSIYVGGHGGNASGAAQVGSGGGGMSDIAITTTVIIAAGGGGGSTSGGTTNENSTGGDGGGLTGGTAIDGTGVTGGSAATGGSQTTGGSATAGSYGVGTPGGYGYGGGAANTGTAGIMHGAGGGGGNGGTGGWNGGGGGCTLTGINDHAGGGGAGYYGGGGGRGDGGAGGGGSSYIGGVTSGATIMFGQTGFVTNPDVTGNGRVHITELCSINLTASGTNSTAPLICSGQSLTLTTNAISNYSWSTGNTTSSVIVVSPTTNTVYALTAMSPSNCMASKSITVLVSSGLPALTITNTPNTICLGQSAILTAGGALSYTWTGGSVPVTNGQSFMPSATATYTVAGGNGCGVSTSTTAITIAPLVVTASASQATVCVGTTATLTAASSVSGYTWMPGGIPINPAVVSPLANTIYTVSASDGTCFGTATVAVNTNPTPTITITASSPTVCEGALVTMTASGAMSYTWSQGNVSGATFSDNPTTATAYQVIGTNSLNCTSQASQIILTEISPTVVVSTDKLIVCSGDAAVLTAIGADSYNWTNGPSTSTNLVNPPVTTNYTVVGTYTNGCSNTKTITINVLTASVAASAVTTAICQGGSTTLTATGANTYTWTGFISINGVAFVTPTITTNYSVTATTNTPGLSCKSSAEVLITVFENPNVAIVTTKTTVCKSDAPIVLTATGAVTYIWSNSLTTNTISVNPQNTTTYSLIGVDANGCEMSSFKQISVSSCNGIGELTRVNKKLLVYPNPSNGSFSIIADSNLDLKLINELGQEVRTIKLSAQNDYKVSVFDLANGIYFVVGQNGEVNISQKIVVSK